MDKKTVKMVPEYSPHSKVNVEKRLEFLK